MLPRSAELLICYDKLEHAESDIRKYKRRLQSNKYQRDEFLTFSADNCLVDDLNKSIVYLND